MEGSGSIFELFGGGKALNKELLFPPGTATEAGLSSRIPDVIRSGISVLIALPELSLPDGPFGDGKEESKLGLGEGWGLPGRFAEDGDGKEDDFGGGFESSSSSEA
jgi:hypothetical protein